MLKTEQPKNLREWILENVAEDLENIAENGFQRGVTGLIYDEEIYAVYDAYQHEIWELAVEQAQGCGYDNALAFMASFKGAKQVVDQDTFKNLLTLYAVEELARTILEEREEASSNKT